MIDLELLNESLHEVGAFPSTTCNPHGIYHPQQNNVAVKITVLDGGSSIEIY